jgi:hypothetical protein
VRGAFFAVADVTDRVRAGTWQESGEIPRMGEAYRLQQVRLRVERGSAVLHRQRASGPVAPGSLSAVSALVLLALAAELTRRTAFTLADREHGAPRAPWLHSPTRSRSRTTVAAQPDRCITSCGDSSARGTGT